MEFSTNDIETGIAVEITVYMYISPAIVNNIFKNCPQYTTADGAKDYHAVAELFYSALRGRDFENTGNGGECPGLFIEVTAPGYMDKPEAARAAALEAIQEVLQSL